MRTPVKARLQAAVPAHARCCCPALPTRPHTQVEDLELRTKYLACVETLQLYLELCCDAATAAQRWRAVSEAVLHRLPDTDQHLHAVFSALALTHADKAAFR